MNTLVRLQGTCHRHGNETKLMKFVDLRVVIALTIVLSGIGSAMSQHRSSGDSEALNDGRPDFPQYEAEIIRVVDADTLTVRMFLLPGLEYTVDVRSRGVDAPEIHRPKCDWERTLGEEAKEAIEARFKVGSWVYIENVELGSFSGRVVADITQWYANQRWRTVSKVLLEKEGRWGVPHRTGQPEYDWCRTLPSE